MKLELLDFIELDNYPTGSGIEFYDDKIYIVGNDSRDLLVMNKKWSKPELINLFAGQDKKTAKSLKSDLETMTLLSIDKKQHLLIVGSGSNENRNKGVLLNLKNSAISWLDLSVFYDRVRAGGIPALNIEGIAEVYDYLVMVNRGTEAKPGNHLIITKSDFWKNQEKTSLQIIDIDFENAIAAGTLGITGLT